MPGRKGTSPSYLPVGYIRLNLPPVLNSSNIIGGVSDGSTKKSNGAASTCQSRPASTLVRLQSVAGLTTESLVGWLRPGGQFRGQLPERVRAEAMSSVPLQKLSLGHDESAAFSSLAALRVDLFGD